MVRQWTMAAGLVGLLIVGGGAAFALFRAPDEVSGPIEAIPVAPRAAEATATEVEEVPPAPEVIVEPAAETETGSSVFEIVPSNSEARFVIDEILRGQPKTVVGATDQVSGQILLDLADPTQSRVGVIQINARTLATDSSFRDRAIQNQILETNQFEFITFTPAEVIGLPAVIQPGERLIFQIAGDLTIRDITRPVQFKVEAAAASETQIEGLATAMIARGDFALTIPSVPQVAGVDENVLLDLEFLAELAG